jgi:hypothetical protein
MRKYIDTLGNLHFLMIGEEIPAGGTEIIEKYKRYRASNGDIHTIMADVIPNEDWIEEDVDFLGSPDPSYVPPYDALRMSHYPQITNQLDMLWHELNTSGSISTSGSWFQSIQEVKENFPKNS